VLVSDETRRLAGEAFPFEPVSPLAVRGKRECIRCWKPQWTRGWCVASAEMADVGTALPAGYLGLGGYHR